MLLIAFAFVLGYGPKEWERRRLAERLEQTELDLRLANLHRQLGMVNFEVQQNNFAGAATHAVLFFEGCRAVANDEKLDDQPRTRLALQTYASTSDTVLGQLGTADPAVKQRLASLYHTMNGVLERKQ